MVFNRQVRRKLSWLASHTRPIPGKPGQIEPKPRESVAFASTDPRSIRRRLTRAAGELAALNALSN